MMYRIGETVAYGAEGLCRVSEITERDFKGRAMRYYVLRPIGKPSATVYVPAENEKLVSKMRRPADENTLKAVLRAPVDTASFWEEAVLLRKSRYREILESGDLTGRWQLVKTLRAHRDEQLQRGKKLHIADDQNLKDAERLLYEEAAAALDVGLAEAAAEVLRISEGEAEGI